MAPALPNLAVRPAFNGWVTARGLGQGQMGQAGHKPVRNRYDRLIVQPAVGEALRMEAARADNVLINKPGLEHAGQAKAADILGLFSRSEEEVRAVRGGPTRRE